MTSADKTAPESVHLTQWPQSEPSLIDERLMNDMRLAMRVASLGRAARSKAGVKIRQPLARAIVRVPTEAAAAGLRRVADVVADETNIRRLEVFSKRDDAVVAAMTLTAAAAKFWETTEEADIRVALETALTPELADEGLARELVHRIQNLRKDAGFEISDHIATYYQGPPRLRTVLQKHGDYVCQETLSDELTEGPPPEGAHAEEQKLDGEPVTLAVARR